MSHVSPGGRQNFILKPNMNEPDDTGRAVTLKETQIQRELEETQAYTFDLLNFDDYQGTISRPKDTEA